MKKKAKKTPARKGATAKTTVKAKSPKAKGKPARKRTEAQERIYMMGYKAGYATGNKNGKKSLTKDSNVVDIKKEAAA